MFHVQVVYWLLYPIAVFAAKRGIRHRASELIINFPKTDKSKYEIEQERESASHSLVRGSSVCIAGSLSLSPPPLSLSLSLSLSFSLSRAITSSMYQRRLFSRSGHPFPSCGHEPRRELRRETERSVSGRVRHGSTSLAGQRWSEHKCTCRVA